MKEIIFSLLASVLFYSCATHTGTISSVYIDDNVTYNDIAVGVARTSNILGIGGHLKDALVLEAKRELIKNRLLNENEQFVNFTIDIKKSYFLVYNQTKVTVSADVIDLTSDKPEEVYTNYYLNKLSGNINTNEYFNVGDTVMFNSDIIGTILSFEDNNHVRIIYKTKDNKYRTNIKSINQIFMTNKSHNDLQPGKYYAYTVKVSGEYQEKLGKIIGLGLKKLIVMDESGKLLKIDYE